MQTYVTSGGCIPSSILIPANDRGEGRVHCYKAVR